MKLLRDDETPAPPGVRSYQETRWRGLFVGMGLFATAAVMIAWPLMARALRSPWLLSGVCLSALLVPLIGSFALRSFFASLSSGNWRIRWSSEGIYLRYRSHLNARFSSRHPEGSLFDWA